MMKAKENDFIERLAPANQVFQVCNLKIVLSNTKEAAIQSYYKPFLFNVVFLYPQETEKPKVFFCFKGT